jgi:hypothetical protein
MSCEGSRCPGSPQAGVLGGGASFRLVELCLMHLGGKAYEFLDKELADAEWELGPGLITQ